MRGAASTADLALLNRGNERTQGRLVRLRELGEEVAKERSDNKLVHIGDARDKDGMNVKEFYAENPLLRQLGIKTIAGSAFADLTFWDPDAKRLYHISLYRVTSGDQAAQGRGGAIHQARNEQDWRNGTHRHGTQRARR